jgi:hypothetical protein
LPNASVAVTFTAGAIATPATTAEGCVVNASEAAAAGETVNAVLVAVSRPLEAVSVLLPTRFTLSAGNVATPVVSVVTAAPPVSVPVPVIVSATEVPGTVFPNASVAVTFTAGAIATPATKAEGCVVNASEAAAACDTVNAVLVAVSRPLLAVSVLLPTRFTDNAANVATPVVSVVIAAPPVSVPVPVIVSATETLGTVLPTCSPRLHRLNEPRTLKGYKPAPAKTS